MARGYFMGAEVHPRHLMTRNPRLARERRARAAAVRPSAREQFAWGFARLQESRPVLTPGNAKKGIAPTFGAPTFRNVIEGGEVR